MASVVGVPVEMYDERFTTVTAERHMLEAGLDAQQRRKVVDKAAAAVMLQAWLDHRRNTWRRDRDTATRPAAARSAGRPRLASGDRLGNRSVG